MAIQTDEKLTLGAYQSLGVSAQEGVYSYPLKVGCSLAPSMIYFISWVNIQYYSRRSAKI